jgi:hypothetical protein
MSHTLDFETVISDQDALIRALVRMGIERDKIEVHETPVCLRTYHNENKVAHIVVRRNLVDNFNGRASDLGFERNDEGLFVGHIDDFQYPGVTCYNEEWQQHLYTYCEVETAKISFEKKGMEYTETKDQQGRIQLRAKFKVIAPENKSRIKIHTAR